MPGCPASFARDSPYLEAYLDALDELEAARAWGLIQRRRVMQVLGVTTQSQLELHCRRFPAPWERNDADDS